MADHLGQLLVNDGLITQAQLVQAIKKQVKENITLGCALVELNYVGDTTLADLISEKMQFPLVGLAALGEATPEALAMLPPGFMRQHKVLPLKVEEECLTVAMVDPTDMDVFQIIQTKTKLGVKPVVALYHQITSVIKRRCKSSDAPLNKEAETVSGVPATARESRRDIKLLLASTDANEAMELNGKLLKGSILRTASTPEILFLELESEDFDLILLDALFFTTDQGPILSVLKGKRSSHLPSYVRSSFRGEYPPVVVIGRCIPADQKQQLLDQFDCETLNKPLSLTDIKLYLSLLASKHGSVVGAHRKKVLIADDMKTMRLLITNLLKSGGYELLEVNNGVEVLETLKTTKVDLILLDCLMPVMDGLDCCRKLKSDHKTKDIPVIMLTSKDNYKMVTDALSAGCNAYVPKPLDGEKLLTKIRFYLSR